MGSPLWMLLEALVKLPGAVLIVERAVNIVVLWYVSRQERETLKYIANAASLASRAKNQEERHAALNAWSVLLSRPRFRSERL